MNLKKEMIKLLIVFIFVFFLALNIAEYRYNTSYNKVDNGINVELQELREMYSNNALGSDIEEKINDIDKYVRFQNTICFGASE